MLYILCFECCFLIKWLQERIDRASPPPPIRRKVLRNLIKNIFSRFIEGVNQITCAIYNIIDVILLTISPVSPISPISPISSVRTEIHLRFQIISLTVIYVVSPANTSLDRRILSRSRSLPKVYLWR